MDTGQPQDTGQECLTGLASMRRGRGGEGRETNRRARQANQRPRWHCWRGETAIYRRLGGTLGGMAKKAESGFVAGILQRERSLPPAGPAHPPHSMRKLDKGESDGNCAVVPQRHAAQPHDLHEADLRNPEVRVPSRTF